MTILLTGFQPFGGEAVNPSWEAARRLPDAIAGAKIVKAQMPTAFSSCAAAMEQALRRHRPDAVICVGQAGGRPCVTVERVAINLADAIIPDNEGFQPADQPIQPGGPAAYFSTLPVKAMVRHIRAGGIPCLLSSTAGTFVCNCLMYQVLHMTALHYPDIKAGFIHVPYLEEQVAAKAAGTPSASLDSIRRALELAVEAVVSPPEAEEPMGTLH